MISLWFHAPVNVKWEEGRSLETPTFKYLKFSTSPSSIMLIGIAQLSNKIPKDTTEHCSEVEVDEKRCTTSLKPCSGSSSGMTNTVSVVCSGPQNAFHQRPSLVGGLTTFSIILLKNGRVVTSPYLSNPDESRNGFCPGE